MRDKSVLIDIDAMVSELNNFIPDLTDFQLNQFLIYYRNLIEWNAKINLTSITDPRGIASKHFADSISASDLIDINAKVIDVGTGAGFPSIPLKIVRPDIEITLLDSLNKRIIFLNELLIKLGIEAKTFHMRADEGAKKEDLREKFDFAVSRAVASTDKIAAWTIPFVKPGGATLMYKGPSAEAELNEALPHLKKLNVSFSIVSYPCQWGDRNIIIGRKNKKE